MRLAAPGYVGNTGFPSIFVLGVSGSQVTDTDINLHTFRPFLFMLNSLPRPLVPRIGRSVTDFIQDVARCLYPYNLSRRLRRTAVISSISSIWWCHQMKPFTALLALCEGIHRPSVDSPHRGLWRGALMFSLMCPWKNGWANNLDPGDLRRHGAHYDFTLMIATFLS